MSKFIILGDTHHGAKNDSIEFIQHIERFYNEVFFPFVDRSGAKIIIQLGDLLDRRKYINFNTLVAMKRMFLDECEKRNLRLITLVGNHDIYYRDSMSIVGFEELLKPSYTCLEVVSKPCTLNIDDMRVDIVPWICKENHDEVTKFMSQSRGDILLGHFEIQGFAMLKGVKSEHGLDSSLFTNYRQVFSGHYHTRSMNENIQYLGTPYEITWSDCDDEKGFGCYDTESRIMQWVPNPFKLFRKLDFQPGIEVDLKTYANSYIKLVVSEQGHDEELGKFIERIYKEADPIDLTIVDKSFVMEETATEMENLQTDDPLSILLKSIPDDHDGAGRIKALIQEVYSEAMMMSVSE